MLANLKDSNFQKLIQLTEDIRPFKAGDAMEKVQGTVTSWLFSLIPSAGNLTIFKSRYISEGKYVSPEDYEETYKCFENQLFLLVTFC